MYKEMQHIFILRWICFTEKLVLLMSALIFTPPPIGIGGRGIVFAGFLCLFLSLFLCQQDYEKTAGPICVKFSGEVRSDHGTT